MIQIENKNTLKYMYISILPLFLFLFPVGDTGRWINMISFISFAYFAQFRFNACIKTIFFPNYLLKHSCQFCFVIICSFFIRLPHCCNLQAKQINIWGGLHKKFIVFYYMQDRKYDTLDYDIKDKYYDIKKDLKN